jgi:hypothetical protein
MEKAMKRFKLHFISMFIIVLLLLLALGTSYPADTELTIINNSSKDLYIKIGFRDGTSDSSNTEEFMLLIGNKKKLGKFHHTNIPRSPDDDIYCITLFTADRDIIKEYNLFDDEENFKNLFDLEGGDKRTSYYTLNITDELLE